MGPIVVFPLAVRAVRFLVVVGPVVVSFVHRLMDARPWENFAHGRHRSGAGPRPNRRGRDRPGQVPPNLSRWAAVRDRGPGFTQVNGQPGFPLRHPETDSDEPVI